MAQETKPEAIRAEIGYWWWLIGTAVGCLSTISFFQKILKIGLAPIPSLIIEYYRSAIAPIRDMIAWVSPISLPNWYIECFVLSFIAMSVLSRTAVLSAVQTDHNLSSVSGRPLLDMVRHRLGDAIFSLFLVGIPLFLVMAVTSVIPSKERCQWLARRQAGEDLPELRTSFVDAYKRWLLLSIGAIFIVGTAFFVWNFNAQ